MHVPAGRKIKTSQDTEALTYNFIIERFSHDVHGKMYTASKNANNIPTMWGVLCCSWA